MYSAIEHSWIWRYINVVFYYLLLLLLSLNKIENCISEVRMWMNQIFSKKTKTKQSFTLRKLKNITCIWSCLTEQAAIRLLHSLVVSRLDYANALLFGITDVLIGKLQRVQNYAARLVVRCDKRIHITPVLKKLHWLPVKQLWTGLHLSTSSTCFTATDQRKRYDQPTTMTCKCHQRVVVTVIEHSLPRPRVYGIPFRVN